jgi:predicted DNA binding CopG/RHH family protein
MTTKKPQAVADTPEQVAEIEEKIALLQETEVTLTLNQELIGALQQQADFKRVPFETYLVEVLAEKTNIRIGEQTIAGPSVLSGTKCGMVTGPSFATNYQP